MLGGSQGKADIRNPLRTHERSRFAICVQLLSCKHEWLFLTFDPGIIIIKKRIKHL